MASFPVLAGFGSGLSLIAAIGAQNAFVLRQGIRREHVLPVVAVCIASDALLILAGVAGFGALTSQAPWLLVAARLGGAAFLLVYAVFAARRALRPAALTVEDAAPPGSDRRTGAQAAVLTVAALTWLNPHVYLDTVVLLGSLAAAQGDPGRWLFAVGAAVASLLWFSALGFGARGLRRFFARPASWRVLDGLVAVVMAALAVSLLLH
ncbi:LysE/ArgO family amino acid transporter [Arthrobacter ginkgonis]|uniref:LysE/ArgO family amino acid transporter n=1 Tax=Arthrobacter ginkgonis TaxID=1630594 RepID=A0ABP7CXI2_9MICC